MDCVAQFSMPLPNQISEFFRFIMQAFCNLIGHLDPSTMCSKMSFGLAICVYHNNWQILIRVQG